MALVYVHKTLNDVIFYVGIATQKRRAFSKSHRNKFWKNFTNKYEYKVEILFDNITREEACKIEEYLIKFHGRRALGTGTLVNLAENDIGSCGYKHTKEARRNISKNNAKTKSKKVLDKYTGKIYPSLKEYSRLFNINYSGLKAKLNGQNPNNTTLIYVENEL